MRHAHLASMETSPQTVQTIVAAPVWLWLPLGQGEPPEADPMVWEVDESPSSMSQAFVTPECVYDQCIEAVAVLPALSPRSTLLAECPLSALLAMSATQ